MKIQCKSVGKCLAISKIDDNGKDDDKLRESTISFSVVLYLTHSESVKCANTFTANK